MTGSIINDIANADITNAASTNSYLLCDYIDVGIKVDSLNSKINELVTIKDKILESFPKGKIILTVFSILVISLAVIFII